MSELIDDILEFLGLDSLFGDKVDRILSQFKSTTKKLEKFEAKTEKKRVKVVARQAKLSTREAGLTANIDRADKVRSKIEGLIN